MQQEQAGLRRDCEADFIRQFQSVAAFKAFLGQEDLHVAEQFFLVRLREPVKERQVARNDRTPLVRHRLRAQPAAALLLEDAKHENLNLSAVPAPAKNRNFPGRDPISLTNRKTGQGCPET